jgi:hypothetical protein
LVAGSLGAAGENVPGIVRFRMTTIWQVPVPHESSRHPANTKPAVGVALRVSVVLAGYLAEHPVEAGVPLVITQLMAGVSPGWLVTLPLPTPAFPLVILMRKGPFRN